MDYGEVVVVSIAVEYIIHLNSVLIRSGFTVRENGELGMDNSFKRRERMGRGVGLNAYGGKWQISVAICTIFCCARLRISIARNYTSC